MIEEFRRCHLIGDGAMWLSGEEILAGWDAEEREIDDHRKRHRVLYARQERRESFIDRFTKHQRHRRSFVNLGDLIGAAASSSGQSLADLAAEMARSIRTGEFDADAKPAVLFLEPDHPLAAIEMKGAAPAQLRALVSPRWRLKAQLEATADGSPLMELIKRCWLPRRAAHRWCERRGFPWPAHFEPEHGCLAEPPTTGAARTESAATDQDSQRAPAPQSKRRRGRTPVKRAGIQAAMNRDLDDGLSVDKLRGMLGKELQAHYGASRDTCAKARRAVLSARGHQFSTIPDS
ncbi:MAG TPA: hypothetical protein VN668_16215 [Stellaceae bacterium]|nr:hypothetical protein [Stellaceae bacterium]